MARSPERSAGWSAVGPAFYICNGQPGVGVVGPSTCGSVQWFEKTASSNGATGFLKVKTMTTTALCTIPEATYEASCAFSVAGSWIASVAGSFVVQAS